MRCEMVGHPTGHRHQQQLRPELQAHHNADRGRVVVGRQGMPPEMRERAGALATRMVEVVGGQTRPVGGA